MEHDPAYILQTQRVVYLHHLLVHAVDFVGALWNLKTVHCVLAGRVTAKPP